MLTWTKTLWKMVAKLCDAVKSLLLLRDCLRQTARKALHRGERRGGERSGEAKTIVEAACLWGHGHHCSSAVTQPGPPHPEETKRLRLQHHVHTVQQPTAHNVKFTDYCKDFHWKRRNHVWYVHVSELVFVCLEILVQKSHFSVDHVEMLLGTGYRGSSVWEMETKPERQGP